MKAIILAAGEGTRLRPLTEHKPKCMVELFGKPLLQHQVEVLNGCGITDIVVVTGYRSEQVTVPGIRCIQNPHYAKTNMVMSLFCAQSEFTDDLLITYGDIVFHPHLVMSMNESDTPISVAVDLDWEALWRLRMEDPLDDAETLKLNSDGTIRELGKEPTSLSDIEAQYLGMIGVQRSMLGPLVTFFQQLDRSTHYENRPFEQMFMTTFLGLISSALTPLHAVQVRGGWCEVDSLQDLRAYEQCGPALLEPGGASHLVSIS